MGLVVMDEAFDAWRRAKKKNDYHLLFDDWHEQDLRAQIRRDRNHPSVILWSIGNEIGEQGNPEGHKVSAELARIVHEEDATRPMTAAANNLNAATMAFKRQSMFSATTTNQPSTENFDRRIRPFRCLAARLHRR